MISFCMDGGDTEVSILAGVEVVIFAEGVPRLIVGVVIMMTDQHYRWH